MKSDTFSGAASDATSWLQHYIRNEKGLARQVNEVGIEWIILFSTLIEKNMHVPVRVIISFVHVEAT
jgi:hypothetical protein